MLKKICASPVQPWRSRVGQSVGRSAWLFLALQTVFSTNLLRSALELSKSPCAPCRSIPQWRRFPLCRCPTGCCRCHRRQRFDRRPVSCRRCNSNKAGGRRSLRQRGQINAPFSVELPAFSALLLHLRQIKFGNQRFNHGPDIIPHPQKLPFVVQVNAAFDK